MEIDEIEAKIDEIRGRPLQLLCLMPSGKTRSLTIRQCWTTGARFIHVDCTEIDTILGVAFGGDADEIAENRRFPQIKGGEPYQTDKKGRKNHSGSDFKPDGSSGGGSLRRERKPDL